MFIQFPSAVKRIKSYHRHSMSTTELLSKSDFSVCLLEIITNFAQNVVTYHLLHGQVRAVCSRPVVSLLWNVVVRPHLRCVRAACCGLSSHGCYSLSSDLLQTVATGLQQRCWKQIRCRPVVTELQQCCCG